MAKLLIKSEGFGDQVLELKLGANRFGRGPESDFRIDHPTVSTEHCVIVLRDEGVTLRDCDSTNGTFLEGKRVKQAKLAAGQTLHLGDVELLVETTDLTIAIPHIEVVPPAPPIVLADGSMLCTRHAGAVVTHKCTYCEAVLCDKCLHCLKVRGGKVHKFCPVCSHDCIPLAGEKPKKKSFLAFLQKTVKLPFMKTSKHIQQHR